MNLFQYIIETIHSFLNFHSFNLIYHFVVYLLELLHILYAIAINGTFSAKRIKRFSIDDRGDTSGEEKIFQDFETFVFSVDLEKAAFTAKRCNLLSSHE